MTPEEVQALLADLRAYRKRLTGQGRTYAAASVGYAMRLVRERAGLRKAPK